MSRAENAVMRLYEDASLRGDLTDEPADRLLKWAEDKLIALDETADDDAAFEAGAEAILASIKQVNRKVGETLEGGDSAGFSAQSAPDEMALVESLIAGIDNGEPAADAISATAFAAEPEAEPTIPQFNIELNPALTSFFTGTPAPVADPEPAAELAVEEKPEESSDSAEPQPSTTTPEEALPHLDIVVNPALSSFFNSTWSPTEPAEDDDEDETDDDDAKE